MLSYFQKFYSAKEKNSVYPFIRQKISVDSDIDPFVSFKTFGKKDWDDYDLMKRDEQRQGLGEGGKPVVIADDGFTKLRVRSRSFNSKFIVLRCD